MGRNSKNCARMILKGKEIVDQNLNAAKYSIFFKFFEIALSQVESAEEAPSQSGREARSDLQREQITLIVAEDLDL